jgi:hypothetical protein
VPDVRPAHRVEIRVLGQMDIVVPGEQLELNHLPEDEQHDEKE